MKTLFVSAIFTVFAFKTLVACDPYYAAFCQTSNQDRFADMNIFAGTIVAKGKHLIILSVLANIRGEDTRSKITIWDGPIVSSEPDDPCPYYASGFTNQYGEVGDTIFCIVELIEEKQNDWEVISDYRKPSTDRSYNTSFIRVEDGLVGDFDNISYAVISYSEFFENPCGVIYGCTAPTACNYKPAAQEDDGSCYFDCEKPVVACPQANIYFCEPTEIPQPLTLKDFEVEDNITLADEINFSFTSNISHFNQYTIYAYNYYFSDNDGNSTNCWQWHYMPDDTIVPPTFDSSINICHGAESSVLLKPFEDNYLFYIDNNGTVGEFVGSCENSNILCFGEHLGISTAKIRTHQFWVSKAIQEQVFFEDKPFYRCESELVSFTLNINPSPYAALKQDTLSMGLNEYYNLMDLVEKNKTGYWRGQDVLSFSGSSEENNFYFYPTKTGMNKIFYIVENGECFKTLTQVIEVQNFRLTESANLSDPLLIFPNPTEGEVYVNLSNSIDVEHSIEVFDINGKLLHNETVDNVKNTLFNLDLSHLPKGVYIIEARNAFNVSSEKLIMKLN